ncbi:MAG: hypothetical protein ACOY5G_13290, partial [Pseudomonadota bacterium]
DMARYAFELSEEYQVPVILRMTSRICHVKGMVTVGERIEHRAAGFTKDAARWVMVPGHARRRLPLMHQLRFTHNFFVMSAIHACAELGRSG